MDPLIGLLAAERLTFTGALGSGGFATVVAATDEAGRALAVKIAATNRFAAAQLAAEAEALEAIGPPWVPRLFRRGVLSDGRGYLAMERLAGATLAQLLEAGEAPGRVAPWVPLAQLLADLHARGWAHGDFTPANVLFDGSSARALDLGLGRRFDALESSLLGELGTAEYLAPERCARGTAPDARSDVYALGVIFFECLTGRVPFGGSPAQVRRAQVEWRVPALSPAHPTGLSELVRRCLAKNPADRFANGGEVVEALGAIELSAVAPPPRSPRPSTRAATAAFAGRRRVPAARIAVAAPQEFETLAPSICASGAELSICGKGEWELVFSGAEHPNPARAALHAAQRLCAAFPSATAVLDFTLTTTRRGADGRTRFLVDEPERRARLAMANGRSGVLLTRAAADALPGLALHPLDASGGLLVSATAPPSAAGTYSAPFFGADELLGEVQRTALEFAAEAAPCLTVVLAPPGHGRSHLCSEVQTRVAQALPLCRVLSLRAHPLIAGGWAQLTRALFRELLDAPAAVPARIDSWLSARLSPQANWAAVAHALGWMPLSAPELQPLVMAGGALRTATVHALSTTIARSAVRRPLLLIVDDAQHADDVALEAIHQASGAATSGAFWAFIAASTEFETARPNFGPGHPRHRRHALGPLDDRSAAQLCRWLLGPETDVSHALLRKLVDRTGGNPTLLVELIRALNRTGAVQRCARGNRFEVSEESLDFVPPGRSWTGWRINSWPRSLRSSLRSRGSSRSLARRWRMSLPGCWSAWTCWGTARSSPWTAGWRCSGWRNGTWRRPGTGDGV